MLVYDFDMQNDTQDRHIARGLPEKKCKKECLLCEPKHKGKTVLFHDKSCGFFTNPRTWDKAIMIKYRRPLDYIDVIGRDTQSEIEDLSTF